MSTSFMVLMICSQGKRIADGFMHHLFNLITCLIVFYTSV